MGKILCVWNRTQSLSLETASAPPFELQIIVSKRLEEGSAEEVETAAVVFLGGRVLIGAGNCQAISCYGTRTGWGV